MRRVRFLAISISMATFLFDAPSALAFFDSPWITPAAPRAGEGVNLHISGGMCDVFFSVPGYPNVTQQGSAIHVIEYGHHEDFQDFCIYGLWNVIVPIGALAVGDYTVTADFLYNDPLTGPTLVNIGTVPFTVAAATPALPVPATGEWGVVLLLVLISAGALLTLRGKAST